MYKRQVKGRVEKFIPEFNKILEKCVDDGTIMTKDPRKISRYEREAAATMFEGDVYERFGLSNLDSTLNKELDHVISVKKGGTSDLDNLKFTSKTNNRRKGG